MKDLLARALDAHGGLSRWREIEAFQLRCGARNKAGGEYRGGTHRCIVAFALGFASPSSFTFAFRRAVGVSPSLFRQRQARIIVDR